MPTQISQIFSKLLIALFLMAASTLFAINLPEEQKPRVLMVKPAAQKIVVSLKPYALLVENIKREGDEVSILIEDGATAHDFQLRPSHLKKIAEADLVIWSGEVAEPTLAKALKNKKQQLALMDVLSLDLIQTKDSHDEHEGHNTIDPHIWLAKKNALLMAKAMADALYYPDEAMNNIKVSFAMLQALEHVKKVETANNTALLVYHNAYAYLEKDLSLQHEFVINESHNSKPSLRHWNELKENLQSYKKNNRPVCLISLPGFENSSEAKLLESLLNSTGMKALTKIVEIDPLAFSGNYKNYFDFYMDSKKRLLSCMSF